MPGFTGQIQIPSGSVFRDRSRPLSLGSRDSLGAVKAVTWWLVVIMLLASLLLIATGCGGGSSKAASVTTTSATLQITWPDSDSRLVPSAANSITVAFLNGSTTVSKQTVARPSTGSSSTLSFTDLPAETELTLTATAYPNTDGTGTAQATASKSVILEASANTELSITMASTISSLVVTPTTSAVVVGATKTLVATAYDTSGAVVLTSSSITFASSNSDVASVDASTGVVTGITEGSATITATDSESGESGTAAVTVNTTGNTIVDLANAYISSLSTAQQTATVVAFDATHAAKWINLPANPSSDGTQSQRNGVAYSTLTTAQKTAWNNLVNAVLAGGTALNQFNMIRAADDVLRNTYGATGYSGDYQYVAFVGTPSTTGSWMFQVGGHHNAHNYYFVGNSLQTTTPYHIATEPTSFTSNGSTVRPLGEQKDAVTTFLTSLSTTQLSKAKLSTSFSDIYLGPGKDARSNFPTGTSGRGALVSSLALSSTQLQYLKNVIAAWVLSRSTDTYSYQSLYESELSDTYVAYSGNSSAPTTAFTTQGDYIRIDGPHVWIELACQNGVVVANQIHYHTIWRDRVTDYNEAFGF